MGGVVVGGGEGLSGGHFCTTWRNICRTRACKACERDHLPGTAAGRILAELSRSRWFARAWEVSLRVCGQLYLPLCNAAATGEQR